MRTSTPAILDSSCQSILTRPRAGPNEKRCIIRYNLGFYSNITVGAIYAIPRDLVEQSHLLQLDLYAPALSECIQHHPFLSVTLQHAESNNPLYGKPGQLDLRNHFRGIRVDNAEIQRAPQADQETALLRQAVEQLHNDAQSRFTRVDLEPAWALDVLLLSTRDNPPHHRVFVSFTYSHSHGDGMSGLAFHRTFYQALQKTLGQGPNLAGTVVETPLVSLPDQPDTASKMPISWDYLLLPALGTYLPTYVSRVFGIPGSLSGADDNTWTGSQTFTDSRIPGAKATTSVEIVTVKAETVRSVLAICRENGGKVTALLDHLIARALKTVLSARVSKDPNLVSQVTVNLRKALELPDDCMGNCGGAAYLRYDFNADANAGSRSDGEACFDEGAWQSIRTKSQQLSRDAANPRNQSLGLLRFVSNLQTWMQSQIGHRRDSSWELSNLGNFDPAGGVLEDKERLALSIEQMLFSQPASPIGPPLTFNVVSVKGGGLSICIGWQIGALGLTGSGQIESEEVEDRKFVKQVAEFLDNGLEQLARLS